ncbi:ESPR-type extended signal peptide-containing protein [Glaciimonas soli]|uniref:Head domain of trimeric autotransporter adhesin n=1 Tax=Glaciimonas soli TaxID=2590999 RepID=A0A843YSF0_9BURK|nr:ESPR-type extended signal peptide-containing protein [Glaciimonas soli]MQR02495.1 hypothetical protein [Glaciimonas soli]
MNNIYRVIWNATAGTWTAAAETAKGRTKGSSSKTAKSLSLALAIAAIAGGTAMVPRRVEASPATAIGTGVQQGATGNVVIGDNAIGNTTCVNDSYTPGICVTATAVGNSAQATGAGAVALGDHAMASGRLTVAIGATAVASANFSQAIGAGAQATGGWATAIGQGSAATQNNASAIGTNSQATGANTTAIGGAAKAQGDNSLAIGYNANASASGSMAFGVGTITSGTNAIGFGNSVTASNTGAMALGNSAKATGTYSVAVGAGANTASAANAAGNNAAAYGTGSNAIGNSSTALGQNTMAAASNSTAVGTGANAAGSSGTAIGQSALAGPLVTGNTAIGWGANADGGTTAGAWSGTAVGTHSVAYGDGATAFGDSAKATADKAAAFGRGASANAVSATAFGAGANASAANSVALGAGSTTTANLAAAGYNPGSTALSGTASAAKGEVSVGSAGNERRVTNVAAGSAATDAVNVSQLTSEAAKSNTIGNNIAVALGGGATYNSTTGAITNPSYVVQGTTYNNVGAALGGLNVGLNTTNTNVTNLTNGINNGTIGLVQQNGTAANVTVAKSTGGTVVDVTGTAGTRKVTGVTAGTLSTSSTDAVNGAQLNTTNTNVTNVAGNLTTLTNNINSGLIGLVQQVGGASSPITVGASTGGTVVNFANSTGGTRTLTNVSAGKNATDAVNVSQLTPVVTALGGGAAVNATTGAVTGPTYALTNANAIAGTTGAATDIGSGFGKVDSALGALNTAVTNNTTAIAGNTTNINNLLNGTAGLVQQAGSTANVTVAKSTGGTAVDVTGTAGTRKVTGVTAGALSATSTDAVNGSQLFETNAQVSQNTTNIAQNTSGITNLDGRVTTNEGNITNLLNGKAGLVQQANDTAPITIGASSDGTVVSVAGSASDRRITGVLDGTNANDAVNLSQLDAAKTDLGTQITTVSNNLSTQIGDVTTNLTAATRFFKADGLDTDAAATVTAGTKSVAIGANSVATEANTVSVGAVGSERKIVNVATGVNDTDAVNVGQLTKAIADIPAGGPSTDPNAVSYDDAVARSSVTLGGVGSTTPVALHNVADGTAANDAVNLSQLNAVDTKVTNVAGNLTTLTNNINNGTVGLVQQAPTGNADLTVGKDTDGVNVNFADKNGATRTLQKVTAGALSATSTDAVNGSQLFETNAQVSQNTTNIAQNTSDITNLANASRYFKATGNSLVTSGDDASATGMNSVAMGPSASASNTNGIAIGWGARASTNDGTIAIGANSNATGENSVALGAGSIASRDNVVSVGMGPDIGNGTRQIINVTQGTEGTDAVNVNQLSSTVAALGGGASISATSGSVTGPTYALTNANAIAGTTGAATDVGAGFDKVDSALGTLDTAVTNLDGRVTTNEGNITNLLNGKAGLVQQADGTAPITIGASTGGTVVSVASSASDRQITGVAAGTHLNDAVNLSQLNAVQDQIGSATGLAVTYDDASKGSVTLGGAAGTQIKNVMAGKDATDAVNVGQLDAAKTDLNTQITNVSNNLSTQIGDVSTNLTAATRFFKADGLDTDAAATVTAGTKSVAIGANSVASRNNSVSVGDVGSERQIVNVAEGTMGTDAVNLDQLTAVKDQVGNLSDLAVTYDDPSKASITLGGAAGTGTQIKNVANGVDNNDAVNVSQLKASGLIDANGNALAAVTYDLNADGSVNYNSVTMGNGKSTGSVAIHNVAAGVDDTDAVNVKQLTDSLTKSGLIGDDGSTLDAVVYDPGSNHGQVTLGGLGATTNVILTNVAAGKVTATSTDAVNGSQLFGLQQQVNNIDNRVNVLEQNPAIVTPPVSTAPVVTPVVANPHLATTDDASGTTHEAVATGTSAVAVGAGANAANNNSVALGAGSVTTQDNSVSMGSAGNERAITNVQAGVNDTDAANVGQVTTAISNSANQTLQSANSYTDQRFNQVEQDINNVDKYARQGIAASAALNMVTPYLPGKTTLNAGVAGYRSQVGLGVGISHWNRRGNLNVNAGVSSAGGNSTIIRAGVGVVLGD